MVNIPYIYQTTSSSSNYFFYSAYLLDTDLDGGCDQQLSDDHQKFMTLTGELSRQHLRPSAVPEIRFVPTKI